MSNTYRDQSDDIADTRIINSRDHVGMMRSPHLWPLRSVLALKKQGKDIFAEGSLGYLKYSLDHPCRVYVGVIGLTLDDDKIEDFASFEDIAAAGWVVD